MVSGSEVKSQIHQAHPGNCPMRLWPVLWETGTGKEYTHKSLLSFNLTRSMVRGDLPRVTEGANMPTLCPPPCQSPNSMPVISDGQMCASISPHLGQGVHHAHQWLLGRIFGHVPLKVRHEGCQVNWKSKDSLTSGRSLPASQD